MSSIPSLASLIDSAILTAALVDIVCTAYSTNRMSRCTGNFGLSPSPDDGGEPHCSHCHSNPSFFASPVHDQSDPIYLKYHYSTMR